MKVLPRIAAVLLLLLFSGSLLALQRGVLGEDESQEMPTDSKLRAEWTFARLHYDSDAERFGYFRGFRRWAADYPKSDRQFVEGVKRLTRVDTRPIEQVVDANSDEIFNWPWIFVEDAGAWTLTPPQAARMREYLERGGFLFLDDTHGDAEWETLSEGMGMILPGASIEDLGKDDELFHVLYDLDDRFQIPGTRFIWGYRRYTADSAVPQWRGVRDDKGRVVAAIAHNSDVGDAWEWADSPRYPERATSLAFRIGINYIIYDMTH